MGVYCGKIGYAERKEVALDVWKDVITEREYKGEVIKLASNTRSGENLNDEININNRISIVADAYAYQKYLEMRYIWYLGTKWKITSVEVARPRLILSIGGVYNGETGPK